MIGKTLGGMWDSYFLDVLPDGASVRYVRDLRRAFYFGAKALLVLATDVNESRRGNPEQAKSAMQPVLMELEQFYRDLRAGKA